jgi:hypothetical protein
MSQGGRVIDEMIEDGVFPGLDRFPDAVSTIHLASAEAFMAGMDRAIVISALAIMAMAVVSYFLIDDRVVMGSSHATEPAELELELEEVAAD